MKGNYKSLVELASEIERMDKEKEDFHVSTSALEMIEDEKLSFGDKKLSYDLTDYAHGQVADRLKIPRKYYNRIKGVPGLRSHNVNTLFNHTEEVRLIRTIDNKARAFLSDKFQPIDNIFLMQSALPVLQKHQSLKIVSNTITDEKMYLQVTFPEIEMEVKKGDIVRAGITISNSEVGAGAVQIQTLIWRLVCSNGMIGKSIFSKYHVGRRIGNDISDYKIFKADTILAELSSFQLRLRDVLAHAISETGFYLQVEKLKKATLDIIEKPKNVVENVTKRFSFTELEQETILHGIYKENEFSRYGLANSITAMAHDIESQEKAYEYEKIGNDVIELKPGEWELISA